PRAPACRGSGRRTPVRLARGGSGWPAQPRPVLRRPAVPAWGPTTARPSARRPQRADPPSRVPPVVAKAPAGDPAAGPVAFEAAAPLARPAVWVRPGCVVAVRH